MSEFIVPSVRTTEPSDLGAATGETSVTEISSANTTALTGQAAALMTLAPPAPGETIVVSPQSGATYILDFGPREASVRAEGGNLVLSFDDSGDGAADRQIVFEDIAQLSEAGEAPTLQIAGTSFAADVLFNEAQALAGEAAPLETAATDGGPDALGGGATAYSDNLGDVIQGLTAQGVLAPTELVFGLAAIEEEETETIELSIEVEPPVAPDFLINEIGVSLFQLVPVPQEVGDPDLTDGIRSFVELRNTTGEPAETADLTVQIINPAGELISLGIPGGLVIPEDGYLVISQMATTEGPLYIENAFQVFTVDGLLVSETVVPGGTPWNLGNDTTEALAVNVVFQAGSAFETGLDTFAANLEAGDLAPLASPSFTGGPADLGLGQPPTDFGSPLLDLNFDTFNGVFAGGNIAGRNMEVFSRVNAEDSDSQNDWTTNQDPADDGLNNSDLLGDDGALVLSGGPGVAGILHVSPSNGVTLLVSEADVTAVTPDGTASFVESGITAAPDGTVYFTDAVSGSVLRLPPGGQVELFVEAAAITDITGAGAGNLDPEDLVFAADGQLYLVDEETNSILRIDPATGDVSSLTIEGQLIDATPNTAIDNLGGLIASADGTTLFLAVDGDVEDGIVAIDVANGLPAVVASGAPFVDLHSFMALAPNGDIIVADNDGAGERLYRVNPANGDVTDFLTSGDLELEIPAPVDLQGGFWFDTDGNFFVTALNTQSVFVFLNTNPATGDVAANGVELFSEAEITEALGAANLLGGTVNFPFPVEVSALVDANNADPLNDDVNPQQDDPDPLAGQNFLQVADPEVGEILEGAGGPDFLLGGAGADSLYGGSQDLVAEQAAKVDAQLLEEAGGTPLSELEAGPYFSDHNDFLFGDAGNDELYGGAGGDYLIGGAGQDSVDGGSGNDRIFGDDDPEFGGLPAPETYNDVLAGDALSDVNGGAAGFVFGGDDSVYGGLGDDLIAGEALGTGENDVSVFNGDVLGLQGPRGNDYLDGEEGANTIAGDALVIAGGASALTVENSIIDGGPTADVGNDTIIGGDGENVIAGDALGDGEAGLSVVVDNVSDDQGDVGNDSIQAGNGGNRIAGDAMVLGGGSATVNNTNSAAVPEDAGVGNDTIEAGTGSDSLSGDVAAFDSGTATSNNTDNAGNDSILAGAGDDFIAGDGLASGGGGLADVNGGGDDIIDGGDGADLISGDGLGINGATADVTDGGNDSILGGEGNDTIYGDSNDADTNGGNDTIDGGIGEDSIFGNSGDDSLLGGDDNDTLDGGIGEDFLDGGDGADQMFGGAGIDTIVFDIADEDGGAGVVDADTDDGINVAFSGDFLIIDESVDFTTLSDTVWLQFETLDLENGIEDTAEQITLNVEDVIAMTDLNNLLSIQGGANGLNAGAGVGDTVNLNGGGAGSNWDGGADQGDYTLYTNENGALVAIDNDVAVMVANA